MKTDPIIDELQNNKNLSNILHVLGEVPSYPDELATELNILKDEVRKLIVYLKKNELIQELEVDSCKNQDIYPLILKKLKSITLGLSPEQEKKVMKNIKFYFISQKGREFLQYTQNSSEENNQGGDQDEEREV